ncbi:DUF6233 domain-containing protein [Streptomyces sp. AD2-2]|nr:DUF6233 domain-containing protein [Streptomyces sp. AD2-2]
MSDTGMSRLAALTFTRRVVEQQARRQLAQIDGWIADEMRREAERERAAAARPPVSDWLLERSLDGRTPMYVHTNECWSGLKSRKPQGLTREQARQALAQSVDPCPACRPDTDLGILE